MRPIRSVAAAAVALLASALPAQQPDRASFYLLVGTDTITVERSERTASRLRFQLFEPRRGAKMDFDMDLEAGGLVPRVTQDIFASDRDTTPAMRVVARFLDDSVGIERGGTTTWIRIARGAMPGMNVSAVLLEQSLMRWRAIGADSVSIPIMVLPGGPSIPMTILRRGADSAVVRVGVATLFAAVSAEGRLNGATIPSQNARYTRGPASTGAVRAAKSYAAPAGAPYTAQDVSIRTPAGLTLRGTLTLPQAATGARVPAVITITGSGAQDRDEEIPGLSGYRPYRQLADTLGRRGIAVLRLDDRGAGSDGEAAAPTPELANDVRAALAWLRARPEIDPRRVGLVGHSEGGLIAPMVAATDSQVAAVVILAGSVSKGREIMEFQQRYVIDSVAHLVGQQRETALAHSARATDSVARVVPWWTFFLAYDGVPAAKAVRAPVLILHGEKDYQVPVAEAEKVAAAVRSGGNRDVTVRVFPGTNHLFLLDAGVGFSYEKLPSFIVRSEVMGAIADWLSTRLAR